VDTQVVHGLVNCGASGVITGVGNVLPDTVIELVRLARAAAEGNPQAYEAAVALDRALEPLARFDEGPDLVLYYKYLQALVDESNTEGLSTLPDDHLTGSQSAYAREQLSRFLAWWAQR